MICQIKRFKFTRLVLIMLLSFSLLMGIKLHADELSIPNAHASSGSFPKTGQTKDVVANRHGSPNSQGGPVGEPPISFWDYPLFTVYFEYDRVIHTVSKEQSRIK